MGKSNGPYIFAGVRFLPDWGRIEVCETNRRVSLSQIQRGFLLALVEKPRAVTTYEELRAKVWPHEPVMDERVQHTIQVTKGNLSRLLEDNGIRADFIESVPGKGYRLAADVSLVSPEYKKEEEEVNSQRASAASTPPQVASQETGRSPHQESSTILSWLLGRHSTFITISSILYGLLFWSALLLEIAYQFDVYRSLVIWPGLLILMINAVAVAAALVLAHKRLREGKGGGLFAGLSILMIAAIGACWLAWLYLPSVPVTLTRFQAQPSIAAFLKNAIIYFLPLGVFCLLIPVYFVVAVDLKVRNVITDVPADAIFIHPNFLLIVCLATIIYSLISSFYMLDNLQTGTYHALFVSLIFIRFIVYFGLWLSSILWYKAALNKARAS